MQEITAGGLIVAFQELSRMTPNKAEWSEKHLRRNPPRLIRLQRLKALARAFELGDLQSVETGSFIMHRDLARYTGLRRRIEDEGRAMFKAPIPGLEWSSDHLMHTYSRLFRFSALLRQVVAFNSGVISASGLMLYARRKTEGVIGEVARQLSEVDEVLIPLISPEGLAFGTERLEHEFGYPIADLGQIDLEYM